MSTLNELENRNSRFQKQMLITVSHDLKTPLATIVGSLEICNGRGAQLPVEKKDTLLKLALVEARRLDNFITNLLDIVKLESGMISIRPEYCNLTNHVKESVRRVSEANKMGDIRLELLGEEIAYIDSMLFSRMIGLLLENAIRQSANDSQISLQYGKSLGEVVVCVRDNGNGLPYKTSEQAFDKFTRFSRSDMQNAGTGLGLTICWLMVNLQQGRMTAENHPDGGTVVVIHIPVKEEDSLR